MTQRQSLLGINSDGAGKSLSLMFPTMSESNQAVQPNT